MHKAILARWKPTVLRLAMIYTALDSRTDIGAEHVEAALAIWEYAENSALWAFGNNSGNREADKILQYLRRCGDVGAWRSKISLEVFANKATQAQMNEAFAYLRGAGLAFFKKVGRSETWYCAA